MLVSLTHEPDRRDIEVWRGPAELGVEEEGVVDDPLNQQLHEEPVCCKVSDVF